MIDSQQLGKRVAVRRKFDVVDGRQRYTDVTGELCELTKDQLRVRRDNGEVVTIVWADFVAGKQIPPKVQRRP